MQINILEGRASYVVLLDHVLVTISYSSRCLTTETVKYINEKGTERQTNAIINNIGYVYFACSEEVSFPVLRKCKQVCVSKLLRANKEK